MRNKVTAAIGMLALGAAILPQGVFAYWTSGYEVTVDGKSIGIIESAERAGAMLAAVNDELADAYGREVHIAPDIRLRAKIAAGEKIISDAELHDGIAASSDKMVEAATIVVDLKETVSIASEEQLGEVLELVEDTLGVDGADSSAVGLIGCTQKLAPEASVLTPADAAQKLCDDGLVSVKSEVSSSEVCDYTAPAIETENPELYEGVREVTEKGKKGKQELVTVKSYVNGELVDERSTANVIDEGVAAKVSVGTKERPKGIGTGKFIFPASGKLTSSFGARWGRNHNGIDIGAPTGTPVYASDDGVVTCSKYRNSYGNMVVIDHGNGYETYYAHNSELIVSEGQNVTKGQLIARVGSTGNSTGPHCHFEIHYNGEIKNPANYL